MPAFLPSEIYYITSSKKVPKWYFDVSHVNVCLLSVGVMSAVFPSAQEAEEKVAQNACQQLSIKGVSNFCSLTPGSLHP